MLGLNSNVELNIDNMTMRGFSEELDHSEELRIVSVDANIEPLYVLITTTGEIKGSAALRVLTTEGSRTLFDLYETRKEKDIIKVMTIGGFEPIIQDVELVGVGASYEIKFDKLGYFIAVNGILVRQE